VSAVLILTVKRTPCVLTIAGSDSGGGAGVQADLKTFAALGVYGMSVLTAITAQNTVQVKEIHDVEAGFVKAQIDAVVEDIGVDAAKSGMLHRAEVIEAVAQKVEEHGIRIVVDPVMYAKGGRELLEPEAINTLSRRLLPLALVATPNIVEAEVLSGIKIKSLDDAKKAAEKISTLGPKAVVVKGGHLQGDRVVDTLFFENETKTYDGERVETKTTHGAGCCFSAAIAAELAKGRNVYEAVQTAKMFVAKSIRFGLSLGHGYGPVNPMVNLYNEAECYRIIQNLGEAVKLLEANPEVASLAPEVQINVAMALPYAVGFEDVAAIPGRIARVGSRLKAHSCPEFGSSKHLAQTILSAMKQNPDRMAALNIRFSPEILAVCEKLGLSHSYYDRREEPEDVKKAEGKTISWGADQAIRRSGKVPDLIYHKGDVGKEPMINLLGRTALEVAEMAIAIAKRYTREIQGGGYGNE